MNSGHFIYSPKEHQNIVNTYALCKPSSDKSSGVGNHHQNAYSDIPL
jgi:hypothetical protein